MKKILGKVTHIIEVVFGYAIMIFLFGGGITFFGYLVAFIFGGEIATTICQFIYNGIYPYLVYFTSITVILGLLKMYLCGETALSAKKNKK